MTPLPDAPSEERVPRPVSRREWRDGPRFVLVAFVVTLLGSVLASVPVALIAVVVAAVRGERSPDGFMQAAQSATAMWATLILAQLVVLAAAFLACRLVGTPRRERLGLVPPAVTWTESLVLLVATIVPMVLGLLAASVIPSLELETTDGLTRMWSEGTRTSSVLWVLTIAIFPGVAEEIFYRGLVLRGFLLRWRPVTAILASSLLFGLVHVDPPQAAATFVLGLWWGLVAWRTGSVLLPIAMHAGVNGTWTAIQMISARRPLDDGSATLAATIAIGVGVAAFLWALRILWRVRPAEPAPRAPRRSLLRHGALSAGGLVAACLLLFAIIPPGIGASAAAQHSWPTVESLRNEAKATIECPLEGEATFELTPGAVVRIALPTNRIGMEEVVTALSLAGDVIWLGYDEEITGKKVGPGVLEQLRSGDPTALVLTCEGAPSGINVRVSLLQDQVDVDGARDRAWAEPGWAIRGRR